MARVLLLALLVAGCSIDVPWPIQGKFDDGTRWAGVSVANTSSPSNGKFQLTAEDGTKCAGRYTYESPYKGKGTIECENGDRGEFTITSNGMSGSFVGQAGKRTITGMF